MRMAIWIGIGFAISARNGAAQTNQDRVRNAIHLPHVAVQFKIEFDPSGSKFSSVSSSQSGAGSKIARLQNSLRGDPSDAAIFVQIAACYGSGAEAASPKIATAYHAAITLFEKQLQMRPMDGWVMSQLGDALYRNHNAVDAEKWLRRSVHEAAKDWRCWANLGDYIQTTSISKALNNDKVSPADFIDIGQVQRLLAPLDKKQGLEKALDGLIASQKDALDAYDKAVNLAPSNSGPYERRFSFRFADHLLVQNIYRIARGEDPVYTSTLPDAILKDEWTASELSPDDPRLQYNALILEIRSHADRLSSDQSNDLSAGLGKLPAGSRDRVTRGLARLTKCAAVQDRAVSASLQVALASIYFLLSDIDDATKAAVKAAAQDPNNEQAGQALVATYLAGKRYMDLTTVLQDQIKHQDSPYKRICLAHVYSALNNISGVSEQVLTGLKLFPEDLPLNLALAGALMKARSADSLQKAGVEISYIQAIFDKLPPNEQRANQAAFDVTRGTYLALIGKPDVARLALQRVLNDDPDNEEAKEVLAAIEAGEAKRGRVGDTGRLPL